MVWDEILKLYPDKFLNPNKEKQIKSKELLFIIKFKELCWAPYSLRSKMDNHGRICLTPIATNLRKIAEREGKKKKKRRWVT